MPTNEEADRTYELALAALRNTIADPDITEDQRRIAQQKRDRLILDFIGQAIANIDARTAKFRAFIREMEEVIAEFDPSTTIAGILTAQGGGRRGCRAGLGGHRDTRPGRSGDVAAHRRSEADARSRSTAARARGTRHRRRGDGRPAATAKPRSKAKVKGKAATPVARKRAAKKPAVRKRVAKKAAAAKKPRAKRPRARRR